MADLCGGHPADVLIAVCLAAKALTAPGRQGWGEVLCWLLGGWGWGWCCLGTSLLETQCWEEGRGIPVCALGHACLSLVGHVEGMGEAL